MATHEDSIDYFDRRKRKASELVALPNHFAKIAHTKAKEVYLTHTTANSLEHPAVIYDCFDRSICALAYNWRPSSKVSYITLARRADNLAWAFAGWLAG